MAFSLNKIQLIGTLGRDAEHRFTTNNTEVTSFSIATNHTFKKDDKWEDETTWHNCVMFGASDFLKSNLKKGKKFFVEGRLAKRTYENKEGQKVYITEVVVDKFNIIPLSETQSLDTKPEDFNHFDKVKVENPEAPEDDDLPF